jgi:hypothetical protein
MSNNKKQLLPEDTYEALLLHTEKIESSTNRPMLKMRWLIDNPEYLGNVVHSYIMLDSPKAMKLFDMIKEFLGFNRKHIDLDNLHKMHLSKCRIHVVKTKYDGKQFNTIKKYYPIEKG